MKKILVVSLLLFLCSFGFSQGVKISGTPGGVPDQSSIVEMESTDKGLLIPRMTTLQRNAIVTPAQALMIYNISSKCFEVYESGTWQSLWCACSQPDAPAEGSHQTSQFQIIWNWNTVPGALGYKWNTVNDYNSATDIGTETSYTQTGLSMGTNYTLYVWAYNSCGIGNSPVGVLSATTSVTWVCGDPLVDSRDMQTYTTVQIGTMCWMSQNLNYGTYVTLASGQGAGGTQKFCYNNTESNCGVFGGLYLWTEMMNGSGSCNGTGAGQPACTSPVQGICAPGWHVPSHYEWNLLERSVGSDPSAFPYNVTSSYAWYGTDEGHNLRETGSTHWDAPNSGATNSSGFTALGVGADYGGSFQLGGYRNFWWTSTENGADPASAWIRMLETGNGQVNRHDAHYKTNGFSVRCVMN